MTDNQGNKVSNAMQLISDLENLVRDRTEERNQYKRAYWNAKVYRSESFWMGWLVGVIGSVGFNLIVRWVLR